MIQQGVHDISVFTYNTETVMYDFCCITHLSGLLRTNLLSRVPPGAPVYAGFRVSDLVEAGDLEAISVASLPLVHEVAEGQHHLQDLSQPLAPNNLLGRIQDGWRKREDREGQEAAGEIILLVDDMRVCH